MNTVFGALAYAAFIIVFFWVALRSPELDPRDEAGMDDDQREALRIIHGGDE